MSRRDGQLADDRALVDRALAYAGHVEDMTEAEKLFLIGALTGALARRVVEEERR